MTVNCYYCKLPVEYDPNGVLAKLGLTLDDCVRRDLMVICNVCSDMAEIEGCKVEIMDPEQFKAYMDVDAGKDAA